MNFKEGLCFIFNNITDKERLENAFWIHCALSDLCHNSYADMARVRQFYAISEKLNIIRCIIGDCSEANVQLVRALYQVADKVCSKEEYDYYVSAVVEAYKNSGKIYITYTETISYSYEERAVDLDRSVSSQKKKRRGKGKKSTKLPEYVEQLRKKFISVCIEHISQMSVFSFIRRRRANKVEYEYLVKLNNAKTKAEADDMYRSGIFKLSQV